MSAEIIAFNRPTAANPLRKKARPAKPSGLKAAIQTADEPDFKQLYAEAKQQQRQIRESSTTVRCVFDGQIFRVKFYRDEVVEIGSVSHRVQGGRIVELVIRKSSSENDHIVAAAQTAQNKNTADTRRMLLDAAIAQVKASCERSLDDADRKMKMIAQMQREGIPQ